MFDVENVGSYEQSIRIPPKYTNALLADAEQCQIGACYTVTGHKLVILSAPTPFGKRGTAIPEKSNL